MTSGGLVGEILQILEHHDLKEECGLLRDADSDPGTILDILLQAHRKTLDESLFSIFYTITYPVLLARAEKANRAAESRTRSEEAVIKAYGRILEMNLLPRRPSTARIWRFALQAMRDHLLQATGEDGISQPESAPIEKADQAAKVPESTK